MSNVSTVRNLTATFEFVAIANPMPEFQWFKLNGSFWNILKPNNKYKIHTSGLYSSLSVRSINGGDYGDYKLIIQNEVGSFDHLFFLLKENGKFHCPNFDTNSFILLWLHNMDNR